MRSTLAALLAAALLAAGCTAAEPVAVADTPDPSPPVEEPTDQSRPDPQPQPLPDPEPTDGEAPELEPAEEVTAAPVADGRPASVPDDAHPATVVRHVDGDTLWVEVDRDHDVPGALPGGAAHSIRVLLIDTPETVHPSKPVECGGPEASAATAALLPVGAAVWVAADTELTDRYDRQLRYLWTAEGTSLGEHLLTLGLAEVAYYAPNGRYLDRYREVEADARRAGRGLHGELPCLTAVEPPDGPGSDGSPGPGSRADGAYANCTEARERGGAPVHRGEPGYGPHLDRDGDGIGCE